MNENPNINELLNESERYLVERGVPNARRNAEWMLGHVLGCRSVDLYARAARKLKQGDVDDFRELVRRRGEREPLQYILGSTEFMGLEFMSRPGVFIPRPDTEIVINCVEKILDTSAPPHRIVDLCCGSGVIAVSLVARVSGARVTAVDVSREAVELTAQNAFANLAIERLDCIHQDAIDYLAQTATVFDLVVSNPPYVASAEMASLPPEVRLHEPSRSLDGGADGLDFYRAVLPLAYQRLKSGGHVVMEIGADQGEAASVLMAAESFTNVRVQKDYGGHPRVVTARRP